MVMLCRLLAGFLLLVTARQPAVLAQASTVVWDSPAAGDKFSSGDTIIGKWQTPEKVVSPSFALCTAGENDCGATVWPEVKESAGYYLVSLAVPKVNKESAYYLRMKDDFGHTYSSPIFTLTSYLQNENNPAPVPPDGARPQNQAPMSSVSTPSSADGADSSNDPAPSLPADPATPVPDPSSAAVPHPAGTAGPLVAAAHGSPPVAALAVPLSLAGAIVLLAGGLALHHRRRLAAERERAREKLARSTSRLRSTGMALNLGSGGSGGGIYEGAGDVDVEKALFAHGGAPFRRGGGGSGFFPDRAADVYYSRAAAGAAALYPYYAPEPRQRARHMALDLLPALGYRRPRPPPPPLSSSSASSSLRRGYLGSVDRDRSRGYRSSDGGGGGGSLWRSLSFSRHRRKVVPPSTLAPSSPSLTESVTSEVLSSYLPSPDLVDQGHRGHAAGNFEFENVPLSPPHPPPLHTRDGAMEPDDSRMRELREVYEAVARALGSTRVG